MRTPLQRRSVGSLKNQELASLGDVWWVERLLFIEHIAGLRQQNVLLQQRLDEAQAMLARSMAANMEGVA